MEMMNRAIEDASDFGDMMKKIGFRNDALNAKFHSLCEVTAWNIEIDRKRAEKKARKAQHTEALNGLR